MGLFSGIGRALGGLIGDLTGASQAADAATQAAATQSGAAQAGINEQRRQFDITQGNLQPFLGAGQQAVGGMGDLLGLNGPEAQAAAMQAVQGGQYGALAQQGEDALLQNASATGGLRGGNTQGALAQFRPQLLNQMIQQQYGNLGGLAGIGSGTGATLGQLGGASAGNIGQLLQQQGAATAGGQIAQGGVTQQGMAPLLRLGAAYFGGF